jgi:hypothetical protein
MVVVALTSLSCSGVGYSGVCDICGGVHLGTDTTQSLYGRGLIAVRVLAGKQCAAWPELSRLLSAA